MKHLEPLMTHLSPLRVAVVRIPLTSDPASGSVRQKDANSGASVSIPRYLALSSCEPASASGAVARPLAPIEAELPGLLEDRLRPRTVAVVLPGDGTDLLLREVVRHLAEGVLLVGQCEID